MSIVRDSRWGSCGCDGGFGCVYGVLILMMYPVGFDEQGRGEGFEGGGLCGINVQKWTH